MYIYYVKFIGFLTTKGALGEVANPPLIEEGGMGDTEHVCAVEVTPCLKEPTQGYLQTVFKSRQNFNCIHLIFHYYYCYRSSEARPP